MDTALGVLAYIAAVMLAVVFGVIAAPAYVKTAKVLIWGSAVPLGIWCFAWELTTEATMPIRVVVGLLVGAFVFVLVPEAVRWMERLPASQVPLDANNGKSKAPVSNSMGNITGNKGIITQGQKGDNVQ